MTYKLLNYGSGLSMIAGAGVIGKGLKDISEGSSGLEEMIIGGGLVLAGIAGEIIYSRIRKRTLIGED